VINKGVDNEFSIKIKKNGVTIPIVIAPSDTFTAYVYKLSDNTIVSTLSLGSGIVVEDANNGLIKLTYTQVVVDGLESERGPKEDAYYLRPTYRIALHCDTIDNGNFIANINEVYVR
jgi:hypothetical protein